MRRFAGGVVVGLLLVTGRAVPADAQTEGGTTCAGHPVTIHFDDPGVGLTVNGTGGPDVIQGGPSAETINAGGGEDIVCGGGGSDDINGGIGRDELIGQVGSDFFTGPDLGQDVITGGVGDVDTADYSQLSTGVGVDQGTGVVRAVGAGVSGGVLGIERVWGTGRDDTLIGGPKADSFSGFGGNDLIDGRGGSNDLRGGQGRDTVTYASAAEKVTVYLDSGLVLRSRTEDKLTGFEVVVGSPFDDRLVGTAGDDKLSGGGGDDKLKGTGGHDELEGGGGDDTLFPGPGDDFVDGGANTPVTSSGAPGDLVSYQGDTIARDDGRPQFEAYLYTSQIGNPPGSLGVGQDTFTGVESVRGVGRGKNLLQGNDGPNVLIGGDGQDYLEGRGGNDLVYGLSGVDILNGDYAAGVSPGIFGDDYLDGGAPTGPSDGDSVHGNGGEDTCTGGVPNGDNMDTCETIF